MTYFSGGWPMGNLLNFRRRYLWCYPYGYGNNWVKNVWDSMQLNYPRFNDISLMWSYINLDLENTQIWCGITRGLELYSSLWHCWCEPHVEGILPKGPYLPCVSMASRVLLAGYPRCMSEKCPQDHGTIIDTPDSTGIASRGHFW